MSGALNYRQISDLKDYREKSLEATKSDTARKVLNSIMEIKKFQDEQNKVTYGTPYRKDGRLVRDKMVGGAVVGTEDLDQAPQQNKFGQYFQLPDGSIKFFSEGVNPPDGSTQLTDPSIQASREATTALNRAREAESRAAYKAGVMDEGRDYNERKAYAELFNELSNDQMFVEEEKKGVFAGRLGIPKKKVFKLVPRIKVGTIEDGYKFKGGDPGNSANWEKVE